MTWRSVGDRFGSWRILRVCCNSCAGSVGERAHRYRRVTTATVPGCEDLALEPLRGIPYWVAGLRDASTIFGRYHTRNGKQYHTRMNEYLADLRVGRAILALGTTRTAS